MINKCCLLFILAALFSCGIFPKKINPVRERVLESLTGQLPSQEDLELGTTDYTFLVCADIHTSEIESEPFSRILGAAEENGDKFVITVGDLTNWGKLDQYLRFIDQVERYDIPFGVIKVIGNHDVFSDGWGSWKLYFGASVYTFTTENARFIMLDSANGTLSREQLDWLNDVLSANTKTHTFVFSHMGVYTGTFSSVFKLDSQDEIYRLQYLLEKHNAKFLFSGHLHAYVEKEINGVTYIITGGAGAGALDSGPNQYIRVHVNGTAVTTTMVEM